MNPIEQLEETLAPLEGEKQCGWAEILPLLNMDHCQFRNAQEEELGLEFMQNLIKKNGEQWLKENRYVVLNRWESILSEYRNEIDRQRKRALKRRRKFRHNPNDSMFKRFLTRLLGK